MGFDLKKIKKKLPDPIILMGAGFFLILVTLFNIGLLIGALVFCFGFVLSGALDKKNVNISSDSSLHNSGEKKI